MRGDWNEGFVHLDWALAADSGFATAHAWLALQNAHQSFGGTMGFLTEEIADKAREHAEAALGLDDRDPFVHMAASMALGLSPRPVKDRGLLHNDMSVNGNPHDPDVMYFRAYHLAYFRRYEEALGWLEKLRALNLVSTYMLSECYTDIYYMMGQHELSPGGILDESGNTVSVIVGIDLTEERGSSAHYHQAQRQEANE